MPLSRHPLSALFSALDLSEEALHNLAESIQEQGLLQPIVVLEGQVLDGWNRYQACRLAGIPATTQEFDGSDAWGYVQAANLHRRHVTPPQRVAVLARYRELARVPTGTQPAPLPTVKALEADLQITHGAAQRAHQVLRAGDPQINAALEAGQISLDRAAKVANLPEPERAAALVAPAPVINPEVERLEEALWACQESLRACQDELRAAHRLLAAEDILVQFRVEVQDALALAAAARSQVGILQERNVRLQRDVNRLKRAQPKPAASCDHSLELDENGFPEPVYYDYSEVE